MRSGVFCVGRNYSGFINRFSRPVRSAIIEQKPVHANISQRGGRYGTDAGGGVYHPTEQTYLEQRDMKALLAAMVPVTLDRQRGRGEVCRGKQEAPPAGARPG